MNSLSKVFLLLVTVFQQVDSLKTLFIGGLFGIDTSRGGWNSAGIVPAVQMAFDDINNSSEVLKDYKLQLVIKDSKCNIGESVKALVEYISSGNPKLMLLGPGCSKAAFPVAEAAHYWNIVQIGFASASPLFSQKSTYPLYFRTNPSEHHSNLGRVAIVKRFKWKQVAILQMNNDVFTGITNSLASLLKQNNISIVTYESFSDNPRIAIENLKKKDARIVFGFFYIKELYMVFCEAFKQGIYGDKYVWILVSSRYEGKWWNLTTVNPRVNCTPTELRQGMSNVLGTGEIKLTVNRHNTLSGQIPSHWYSRYVQRTKLAKTGVNIFASYGYDAAWTCALTLNTSIGILDKAGMKLEDFNYTNRYMREVFVDVMRKTTFLGMTGHVRFDKNFDRISQLEINQLQGDEEKRVALYDMETNAYIDSESNYEWLGSGIPVDSLSVTKRERIVPRWLFWLIGSLSIAGIIFATLMLSFNIYKRDIRYIKMSSPNLNNALVVGCILVYGGGITHGYDGNHFYAVCQMELWLITLGFTLGFGAMFSKTWRVHVIFLTSKKTSKRVVMPDTKIFGMLGVLLLVDLIILITWEIIDPLVEVINEMQMEVSGDEAVLPYIRKCSCEHVVIWKSIMLVYKGLLLLFGAYLAWETRQVHIPALNDSKLIGMCVYNTVVLFTVIVPLQSVLLSNPTVSFALVNVLTIFCTTFTLCVVFIPKIYFLRHNDGNDIQACTGSSSAKEKERPVNPAEMSCATTTSEL